MSDSTWWVDASDTSQIEAWTPQHVEAQGWADAYGTAIDTGNGAIWMEGVCIEGTPEQLLTFARVMLTVAEAVAERAQ